MITVLFLCGYKTLVEDNFVSHEWLKQDYFLNEIAVIDFDHSDVVRHPLVSKIVKAYSDQEND